MKKTFFKFATTAALFLATTGALVGCQQENDVENFPSRSVSMYVPFSAGGGTDLVARAIVEAAREDFPRGIAVENRTGGGGVIGMMAGANASADGTVLTSITVELVTLPHMGTADALGLDSFQPVLMLNPAYSVITVNANSDFHTLEDLIDAARSGDILVGNSGVGAIWHLAAAALGDEAGVDFVHVPFEGAADAVTSLLGNHIDAIPVSYAEVSAQVAAGELRVLAVLAPERNEAIADVPTAKELGFDVAVGTWRGIGVPAGTPEEIVNRLYEIFSEAAADEAFIEFMESNNLDIDIQGPEVFAARIESDYNLFKQLIADLDIAQ